MKKIIGKPLLIGLMTGVILGLVLGGLTEDVLEKESIVKLDNWVLENTHLVQSPGLTRAMIFISSLGGAYLVWPVTVLSVIWFIYKRRVVEAKFILFVVAGGGILDIILKNSIQRARPVPPGGRELVHAWGWGYPSGHALMSVIFYFTIAYFISRRFHSKMVSLPAFAIASLTAGAIALSRVYLQVHYLSDVLAGLLAGLIWFIVCLVVLEYYRKNHTGI